MKHDALQQRAEASGFSLPELLISVSLLGIMAGIGGAYYQRGWEKEQLKAANKAATEWLEDKRMRAIQGSKPCYITINDSTARLEPKSFEEGDKTENCIEKDFPGLDLRSTIPNLRQLKICSQDETTTNLSCNNTTASEQETQIEFTPRGTVSKGGLMVLHAGDNIPNRCIAITQPLGLIRQGIENEGSCYYNTAF